MKKLSPAEVMPLKDYEAVREDFRKRVIDHKKARRVAVGEHFTFVFEDRKTVLFQVHEMLRAERIVGESRIAAELEIYNQLIPDEGELSSTLLLEYERTEVRAALERLRGLSKHVNLHVGPLRVKGVFEEGREREDLVSAVQYVRFRFSDRARESFGLESEDVLLVVDHPEYSARTILTDDVRASLAVDLGLRFPDQGS